MKLVFTDSAWSDYLWFLEKQPQLLKRINELLKDCKRNPFSGIGKPEPLKGRLRGCWSRRITGEHRLVYKPETDSLIIISCRFHYA